MIKVEIVTPQGLAFSNEVNSVNVPTAEGAIGVLQNHMYLMTPERVLILAEEAYEVGEIDVGKAKKEFEEAMKKLATAQTLEEIKEWEKVKEKAQALLEVVERLR